MVKALRKNEPKVTSDDLGYWTREKILPDAMLKSTIDGKSIPPPKQAWTTLEYECELITPMYGGGVEPGKVDKDMPIRATEIRGHLRFWWRLLYCGRNTTDGNAFGTERSVWGEAGNSAESTVASQVLIYVADQKFSANDIANAAESKKGETHDKYKMSWQGIMKMNKGLQYALFSALGKCDGVTNTFNAPDSSPPGSLLEKCKWQLKVCIQNSDTNNDTCLQIQIENVIRWWAAFGGIGARTRRGLGALCIKKTGFDQPLKVSAEEVHKYGCSLHTFGKPFDKAQGTTQLNELLFHFKNFRQAVISDDKGYGRKAPSLGRSVGKSRWPEADLVRRFTDTWFGKKQPECHLDFYENPIGVPHTHQPTYAGPPIYPRAAFGLPLILHFMDPGEPKDVVISPNMCDAADKFFERFASPVIMKPVITDSTCCQLQLLLFPNTKEPIDVRINYTKSKQVINPTQEIPKIHTYHQAWTDPIQALISYLETNFLAQNKDGILKVDEVDWGIRTVKINSNGVLVAQHENGTQSASASKEQTISLLANVCCQNPEAVRQLQQKRRYKFKVAVANGSITKLEVAA